jgi:hypothetical protein
MPTRVTLALAVLIPFFLFGCATDIGQEPFDYARDTPLWLKTKIAVMATDTTRFYFRTKVYRYEWHSQFVYHISIPVSSCMYCEIYDHAGNKIQIANDSMLQDFLSNRKDEVLVWEAT